jgi:hypothetical protein
MLVSAFPDVCSEDRLDQMIEVSHECFDVGESDDRENSNEDDLEEDQDEEAALHEQVQLETFVWMNIVKGWLRVKRTKVRKSGWMRSCK